jgi:hypothetical protein
VDYNDNENIISIFSKIWSFIKDAVIECESKQLDVLSNLIIILLNVTCLKNFQDDAFYLVYIYLFIYLFIYLDLSIDEYTHIYNAYKITILINNIDFWYFRFWHRLKFHVSTCYLEAKSKSANFYKSVLKISIDAQSKTLHVVWLSSLVACYKLKVLGCVKRL